MSLLTVILSTVFLVLQGRKPAVEIKLIEISVFYED
jgi:hypothetical protein